MPMLGDTAINKRISAHYQETLNRYQGATTMALLVESMEEKTAPQRAAFVAQQQMKLPFNLALKDLDTLVLTDSQLLALHQKKLVYSSENKFLYMMLAGKDQVLVIQDLSIKSDFLLSEAEREGMGLMALLQRQLRQTDQQQWDELVARKAQLFSFAITLQSVGEFPLNQQQQEKLQLGRLVAITTDKMKKYGSGLDYLLQLTPNRQQVLVIGPMSPAIQSWITEYQLINTLQLGIIFISLLCLWMWPTWLSSRELMVFIDQQAQQGVTDKLKQHFGSNFNALHTTFNQMSDNIKRLFSHNQTAIHYLTQRLGQPIQDMQRECVHINATTELFISTEQLKTFDNSIDIIRHLSSEILLFSHVQRISSLPNISYINLTQWLNEKHHELQLAAPQLKLEMHSLSGYAQIDSNFLLKGLSQILTVINAKGNGLNMLLNSQKNGTTLLLKCNPVAQELEQELKILCTAIISPSQTSQWLTSSQEQYLALICSAKILQLHQCQLQLRVLQGNELTLEITFPQFDRTIEKVVEKVIEEVNV